MEGYPRLDLDCQYFMPRLYRANSMVYLQSDHLDVVQMLAKTYSICMSSLQSLYY